jgi:hypothetical protein
MAMLSNFTQQLHEEIAAVCPIISVTVENRLDRGTWAYIAEGATAQQLAAADAILASFPLAGKSKRTLLEIGADLNALPGAQKNAIWANFTSGSPQLWMTDDGPNTAAIACLHLMATEAGLSAAGILAAKLRAVAMFVQDNPRYLVNPAFDPIINIPGRV